MGKTGAGKYRSFFALQKRPVLRAACVAHAARSTFNPPVTSLRPPGGHGERIPRYPFCRFAPRAHTFVRIPSTPQSLRDSPLGGTGKGFPDTPSVASLRVRIPSCAYLQPPSHFVTAPWGHWGPNSPDPFCRFAPGGAWGAWGAWGGFYGRDGGEKTTVCGFCRSLCSLGSCGGTGCLCREGKR